MKVIRNKTARPLRISLGGGKVLHLGPHKDGEIADGAADHDAIQKLVKEDVIEILGEGERHEGGGGPGAIHGESPSHAKSAFKRGHGER